MGHLRQYLAAKGHLGMYLQASSTGIGLWIALQSLGCCVARRRPQTVNAQAFGRTQSAFFQVSSLLLQIPIDGHPSRLGAHRVLQCPILGVCMQGQRLQRHALSQVCIVFVKPGLGSWRKTAVCPMWQGWQQTLKRMVLDAGASGSSGAWGCAGFHCTGR